MLVILFVKKLLNILVLRLVIMSFFFVVQVSEADANQLTVLARISDFHVYAALNAKNQFRAPTEWGICLRPSGIDSDQTAELEDDVDFAGHGATTAGLCCLACDSERARTCWLTAMRLAKVTHNLKNYTSF